MVAAQGAVQRRCSNSPELLPLGADAITDPLEIPEFLVHAVVHGVPAPGVRACSEAYPRARMLPCAPNNGPTASDAVGSA